MTVSSSMSPNGPYIELKPKSESKLEVFLYGKMFEIVSFRRRVGGKDGEWQTIDLSKLSDDEKNRLIRAAEKSSAVFEKLKKTPSDLTQAQTFTLRFNQDPDIPGFFYSTPQPKVLQEITYKLANNPQEKIFKVALEKYAPEDQQEILTIMHPLTDVMERLAKAQLQKPSNKKPSQQKIKKEQLKKNPTAQLATAIHDAGSEGNKCAARSIAFIQQSQGNQSDIDTLPKELVNKAIQEIQNDKNFVDPNHPYYFALISAVEEYNKNTTTGKIELSESPEAIRDAYLQKMEENGQMLDYPFFLTLDKPTIILEKDGNGFKIKAFAKEIGFDIPIDTLSLDNLKDFYIVLYVNQNHYQAVLPETDAHLAAVKTVLQNYEKKTLEDVRQAIPSPSSQDLTQKQYNTLKLALHSAIYFSQFSTEKITSIITPLFSSDFIQKLRNASGADDYYTLVCNELAKKILQTS